MVELKEAEASRPPQFVFCNAEGKEVGRLYIEAKLRFEGDVEESAKAFFDYLCQFTAVARWGVK